MRDPRLRGLDPDLVGRVLVPEASYGAAGRVAGAMGRRGAKREISDPRLRGLSPTDIVASRGPVDMVNAKDTVMNDDPRTIAYRRARETGKRLPLQYEAPSALAGRPSLVGTSLEDQRIYAPVHPDAAVWHGAQNAGWRTTQSGLVGSLADEQWGWDTRKRFGYGPMGSRDGFSDQWDTTTALERTAGSLTATGVFDQKVDPERPYLQLRATGRSVQAEGTYDGNAVMRVTASNYENGSARMVREFWLGGGMVASFNLKGWNVVKIRIQEILADTEVQFAWTIRGLHGDDRTLYLPRRWTAADAAAGLTQAVPEGAYAVMIENPIPAVTGTTVTLTWTGRSGGVFSFVQQVSDNSPVATPRPYAFFGDPVPVKAPTFMISDACDLVWMIRPI